MMSRAYKAYTLWMKEPGLGWSPHFTVEAESHGEPSPLEVIECWMDSKYYSFGKYWKRGKNWMIKPKGQEPTELARVD